MINIRKEITKSHTLYLTKLILYRTRTEQGLEAYEIMKRIVYVAYRRCGNNGFITYTSFLHYVLAWLDSQVSIYEFMSLGGRIQQAPAKIFGLDIRTVLMGTYAQIEQQLLNKRETLT